MVEWEKSRTFVLVMDNKTNQTRTEEEYFAESKRLREKVMLIADSLKDNPMRFVITNGITMDVEITKSDLKTFQCIQECSSSRY